MVAPFVDVLMQFVVPLLVTALVEKQNSWGRLGLLRTEQQLLTVLICPPIEHVLLENQTTQKDELNRTTSNDQSVCCILFKAPIPSSPFLEPGAGPCSVTETYWFHLKADRILEDDERLKKRSCCCGCLSGLRTGWKCMEMLMWSGPT